MKKILLTVSALIAVLSLNAQTNVIKGGNMEKAEDWTVVELAAGNGHTETFNYTEALPSGGEGGCLRMTNAGNWGNVAVCQAVTIQKNVEYLISMDVKTAIDLVPQTFWFEVVVLDSIPATDADFSGKPIRIALNSWDCADVTSVDGSLAEFNCDNKAALSNTVFIEGEGDTTVVLAIKTGGNAEIDILIDNIALTGGTTTTVTDISKTNTITTVLDNNNLKVSNLRSQNLTIYSVTGQVVKTVFTTNSEVNISISDLPSGMYVLNSGNESKKFIK